MQRCSFRFKLLSISVETVLALVDYSFDCYFFSLNYYLYSYMEAGLEYTFISRDDLSL
ncbi:hypothetical protein CLV24_12625 [Pontibacter ummariensis]|uniref:Uncharacterized protein n=1 Tax=Pontibacter ummariensis TaxID=1610492 RepID=A0A239K589_9BACT|nr:hypothetical protein CLV24_12625 [Pontibacter ummariensis]SNT13181.1 hypothetical protein SAMN06296052_12628 [Pontibacter ummariensis]